MTHLQQAWAKLVSAVEDSHLAGEFAPHPPLDTPQRAFNKCERVHTTYVQKLRSRGVDARLIRLGGSPSHMSLNAVPQWQKISPQFHTHYVAKVGSDYVDWTARQFDPKAGYPHISQHQDWRDEDDVTYRLGDEE